MAFKFLTIWSRFNGVQMSPDLVGKAVFCYPVVGLALGLVLASLNRVSEPYLESEILSVVIITTLIIMTGAIHLEGLQKTFDTVPARTNSPNRTAQPTGIYGLLAILLVVLFKIRAIEVVGETRSLTLLLTPVYARWALVIFLYGSTSAADQTARVIAENVKAWHLLLTTAATLTFAVLLIGRLGLWIGLYLSLFALLSRSYLQRRHGGIGYNYLGTLVELSETLSFILFASL